MQHVVSEFMRFSAPDPVAFAQSISETRIRLADAVQAGNALAVVDAVADLGGLLTTARQEAEAAAMLEGYRSQAEDNPQHEAAGWFWNAYATALQYCGRRSEAEPYFVKAITLAKAGGWRRFEALALHHWGRSLAEQQRFSEAESRISQALTIRIELNEPRQESSRRALLELSARQNATGSQHARSAAQLER